MPEPFGWRGTVLTAQLLGHAAAAFALWWDGWLLAVACIAPTHLLLWWGILTPGSRLLTPLIDRFEPHGREVWLTFDDGPSRDTTALLDLLDAHDARATFFLVGARAAADPDGVREIVARGHTIGNHSQSHPSATFWALSPAQMAAEISGAQTSLQAITGSPPRLFRAAVGMANPFVAPLLRRHRLRYVAWTTRAFDAINGDAETVWRRLQRRLRPGAIVLLHEGAAHGRSVAVAARVLQELDALGYRCVDPSAVPEDRDAGQAPNQPRARAASSLSAR